jgi:hypothetical protein
MINSLGSSDSSSNLPVTYVFVCISSNLPVTYVFVCISSNLPVSYVFVCISKYTTSLGCNNYRGNPTSR